MNWRLHRTAPKWPIAMMWALCTLPIPHGELCCCAQDTVRPGRLRVRLKTIAAWNPVRELSAPNLELTPTDVIPLKDGTQRLLVSTLGGTLRVLDGSNGLLAEPLLTSAQVGLQLQQESGMTGIAVHPNFAADRQAFGFGKLYTITTENSEAHGGLPTAQQDFGFAAEVHQDVLREWDLSSLVGDRTRNKLTDFTLADSREILRIAQPGPFHNVFDLAFNRSAAPGEADYGELYITSGDGGNSTLNASTTASRKLASQDLSLVYGKLLRINPDPTAHELVRISRHTGQPAYSIANDNPFQGDEPREETTAGTLAEIYAYGLRSPFRIGIDAEDGRIFVSDVGESKREEVSLIERAGNYGWGKFEGTRLDNDFVELAGPAPHTPPLFEYGRDVGSSAIGGTVYRGKTFPQLRGKYVFADFGQRNDSARLFYGIVDPADPDYGEIFEFDLSLSEAEFPISTDNDEVIDRTDSPLPDRIFSLGEDADGELLLVAGQDPRTLVASVEGAFIVRLTRGLGCDLNGDDQCTLTDLDLLTRSLESADPLGDVNWNDVVDSSDVPAWLQQANQAHGLTYRAGDVNLDLRVDFADFLVLQQHFGELGTAWSEGNFDGLGGTDFGDFLVLSANFSGGNAATMAVPAPSGGLLFWVAGLSGCGIRRWIKRTGSSNGRGRQTDGVGMRHCFFPIPRRPTH